MVINSRNHHDPQPQALLDLFNRRTGGKRSSSCHNNIIIIGTIVDVIQHVLRRRRLFCRLIKRSLACPVILVELHNGDL
jgi:hypothetical protein